MKLSLFDYYLPKELIAQNQMKPRDHSRLLVFKRRENKISHDYFYNLDKYLNDNDVLVFNDSKVIPARILFDNGRMEIFLLKELDREWEIMGRKLEIRNQKLGHGLSCMIIKRLENGNWLARFNLKGNKLMAWLSNYGETPLPPYIKVEDSAEVRKNYQTIYAKNDGSVAAPTAGLHFTKILFKKLKKKGVKMEFVTLHVGQGTFQPVKTKKIEEHKMHAEYAVIDKKTAERLNEYKKQGKRIIAVGTTSARVLEAMSGASELSKSSKLSRLGRAGKLGAGAGEVNIFIYPGYKFKFVNSLITNFHLPKSTLLMLVSALAGRKRILRVYQEAIKRKYRFYSFGDGMFIN